MNENDVKKDLYKSKNLAKFSHYVSGNLYYRVELADGIYQFPIATVEKRETPFIDVENFTELDINLIKSVVNSLNFRYGNIFRDTLGLSEDLGQTSFEAEIKGSDLNRWISKAIKNEEFIKVG